jgi:nucleotide-binding universal stress UspA family protein
LAQFVTKHHVDLVTMTTHGRGPLARAWLGSVADELMRSVTVPVLLVRPKSGDQTTAKPHCFQNVLIALDGTPRSESILAPALELAKPCGAAITLLRVVEMMPASGLELAGYGIPLPDAELLETIRTAAGQYLTTISKPLIKSGLKINTAVVEHPHIATCVLDEAKRRGCDLIAMSTHGYGGLTRLILGSATDKVIRGADAAVLVYHTMPAASRTAEAPGDATMDSNELTTVFTTGDPNLARIVANELEAEGIPASVSGENQAGLSGILDVEVLVRAWDADRAREVIHEGGHHARGLPGGQEGRAADAGGHATHDAHMRGGRKTFRKD